MRRAAFSLGDFLGFSVVCCFVLAAYRVGQNNPNEQAFANLCAANDKFIDAQLRSWAADEVSWLELREFIIAEELPIPSAIVGYRKLKKPPI